MPAGRIVKFVFSTWLLASPALAQSGPLSLTGPDHLVLGEDSSVELTARSSGGSLRFFTNVGQVEVLGVEDGTVRARYTPPAAQHPHVAFIVAATEGLEVVDWMPLALYGRPSVGFSFERSSRVTVRVGSHEHGPVRTDRSGEGELQLEVPPGVTQALAVGTDRLGNTREQVIELSPPPFGRVFAVCSGETVEVFTVNQHGGRDASATPRLSGSAGTLSAPEPRGAGRFTARVHVDSPLAADTIEVAATIPGSEAPGTCELPLAEATDLSVALSEPTLIAGNQIQVEVRISLTYPSGAPPRLREPRLEVDAGELDAMEHRTGHGFSATWTLRSPVGEPTTATVSATLGDVSSEASIEVRVPPPEAPLTLGVQAGFLTNFGKVNGPLALVFGGGRIRLAPEHALILGAAVGYFGAWDSRLDQTGTEQVDFALTGLPILAQVGYELTLGPVDLYLRAFGGALIAFTEVSSQSTGSSAATQATWAVGGALGGGPRLGPGLLALEAGYLYAPLSGDVEGNAGGLAVTLGYVLRL